jgi:hypothetical protein
MCDFSGWFLLFVATYGTTRSFYGYDEWFNKLRFPNCIGWSGAGCADVLLFNIKILQVLRQAVLS